jgi:hypothetical protein
VNEFANAVGKLSSPAWIQPPIAGKWSPALLTEHVRLAIEVLANEARGGPPVPIRVSSWQALSFRLFLLPGLLRSGKFPPNVRAPREFRPADAPQLPADAIEGLRRATSNLDRALSPQENAVPSHLTHPYFGRLKVLDTVRLLELHARHHMRQLPRHG